MKKYFFYITAIVALGLIFTLESCGRSTIRRRSVWFGDHNVTVVKKHKTPKVRGGVPHSWNTGR